MHLKSKWYFPSYYVLCFQTINQRLWNNSVVEKEGFLFLSIAIEWAYVNELWDKYNRTFERILFTSMSMSLLVHSRLYLTICSSYYWILNICQCRTSLSMKNDRWTWQFYKFIFSVFPVGEWRINLSLACSVNRTSLTSRISLRWTHQTLIEVFVAKRVGGERLEMKWDWFYFLVVENYMCTYKNKFSHVLMNKCKDRMSARRMAKINVP